MTPTFIKFAATSLVLGASVAGFTSLGEGALADGPAAVDSRTAANAARAAERAQQALAAGQGQNAVRYAEEAVEYMPYSAEYRHLLGQAYFAAGRFGSAETSFQDALAINPNLTRTAFNLALAQIAQGDNQDALEELNALEGRMGASDLGLAMALAGNRDRAITILSEAARANGGDPRARQNLALAYALDGRWGEARITAAQDVSLSQLDQRMRDWMQFTRPRNSWDQVSSLLGVDASGAANDPGQPMRLALAPVAQDVMVAQAAPAEAPVVAFTAPAPEANVEVAAAPASPITEVDPTPVIVAEAGPVRVAPPAEMAAEEEVAVHVASAAPYAAPVAAPRAAAAPVRTASLAPARIPARRTVAAAPVAAPAASADGRYVVQIGAFAQRSNVSIAWERARQRYSALASYTPDETRHGSLHRLSFGGFASQGEADALCAGLRQRGVDCFVRTRGADAGVRMAASEPAGDYGWFSAPRDADRVAARDEIDLGWFA